MLSAVIRLLFCLALVAAGVVASAAQKNKQSVGIVGCYSDLREVKEGIIGNGVIKIAIRNGKYIATFSEAAK